MDKTKALDAALSQIERAFGKGSIIASARTRRPLRLRLSQLDRSDWISRWVLAASRAVA